MARKKKKKRVKVAKPKSGGLSVGGAGGDGASLEELEKTRQLKQDKIDAQLVHVYQLDSIQQVRDLRQEAAKYGVSIEQMMDDTRIAKEMHGFTNVKDYYFAKDESAKYNVKIGQLLKDREIAKALEQKDVGAYYELRKEALSYRITPQQLLLDREEAKKLNLKNVRMLYKQRLESKVRDIRVTVVPAGSTKCQVTRSRLAGAFCFYGDFWDTTEYRIDAPWNIKHAAKIKNRVLKGLASLVVCHRSYASNTLAENPQFSRSLYPLEKFHPNYEFTDLEKKEIEQKHVANIKRSDNGRKKSKKRKGDKDKAPEDGDQAHGKPLSIIEECVGSLLNTKKKYNFKYTIYRLVMYADGNQEVFVYSFEEKKWEYYHSQMTHGFMDIHSVDEMINGMHDAMTTPIVKSRENKFARLDVDTLAPTFLSNQAGRPEFVVHKNQTRTTWVVQVQVKRKKHSKNIIGVLSFVDIAGTNMVTKQPYEKFASNENRDLLALQEVLSEFGSESKTFPKIGYSSSLIYNILRPHLPVRPGCIDVPRLDKKQKRRFEKAKLDKIEMYRQNFNGTHVICVVELGKHNVDHVERLRSWQNVYYRCTGFQNALILQMTVRRYFARKELKKREDEREFRKESAAAIKVQTRIRMIFAKRRARAKRIEKKKMELQAKAEKIREEKKKFAAQQRLEKKRALLAMKQRENEKKIMAEGGYLPEGWKKEKRGGRWCFCAPNGEWTWDDPRKR